MSESVTISLSRPRKPKSIGSLLKEMRQQRRALNKLSLPTDGATRQPAPSIWPGWDYELAREVRDELGDDWRKPGKFNAALEVACGKYVDKYGRRKTPKSLWQNLRRVDCSKCCKPLKECRGLHGNVATKKPS